MVINIFIDLAGAGMYVCISVFEPSPIQKISYSAIAVY